MSPRQGIVWLKQVDRRWLVLLIAASTVLIGARLHRIEPTLETMLNLQPTGMSWDAFIASQDAALHTSPLNKDERAAVAIDLSRPLFLEPSERAALRANTEVIASASIPWTLTQLRPIPSRYQWEGYAVAADGSIIALIVDTQTQRSTRVRIHEGIEGTSLILQRIELQPEAIAYLMDRQSTHTTLTLPLRQCAHTGDWEATLASCEDPALTLILSTHKTVTAYDAEWTVLKVDPDAQRIEIEKRTQSGDVSHYTLALLSVDERG
ncbi:MAG TPA: hypothetical protein PLV25_05750, partial [Opitutales bacterium]|nr:hypothetical protein [Opitutales bacterium]